jgi:hypothetical protein
VWDGDTLAQELRPNATVTYLYEPDSFVPLVWFAALPPYELAYSYLFHIDSAPPPYDANWAN